MVTGKRLRFFLDVIGLGPLAGVAGLAGLDACTGACPGRNVPSSRIRAGYRVLSYGAIGELLGEAGPLAVPTASKGITLNSGDTRRDLNR